MIRGPADLVRSLVRLWHGDDAARQEEDWFLSTISRKIFPADAPRVSLEPGPLPLLDLVLAVAPEMSRSAARRLIAEGGVRIDDSPCGDPLHPLELATGTELALTLGIRRFVRVSAARKGN